MSDVKVAFLTDSCSDIPQELTDKYGIDVIGWTARNTWNAKT